MKFTVVLPQDLATGSSPTFVGLTLTGLTASLLVATDGSKALASVTNLALWIAGTANRITVADDGDGTITLSAPQDIHTAASPTFAGLTVGTLTGIIKGTTGVLSAATAGTDYQYGLLTATRVPYATGTPATLTDSVNLTFSGTVLGINGASGAGKGVALSATAGKLTLAGQGNTNNENLILDFETTANQVTFTSGTAATVLHAKPFDAYFNSLVLGSAFAVVTAGVVINAQQRYTETTGSKFGMMFEPYVSNASASSGLQLFGMGCYPTQYGAGVVGNLCAFYGVPRTTTDSTGNVTGMQAFQSAPVVNAAAGGRTIATLGHFYANNVTKGATAAITTVYAFYDAGQTTGGTNWGLAINTQSYINAALSVGKNTAPTASNLNLAATYNIEKDTNDLTITTASQKTLVLSQPVYKDINLGAANFLVPAAGYPDKDELKDEAGADTGIEVYAFGVDEGVSSQFEIQHDYKEGTDIVFHVHWEGITAPAGGTDNVQWRLAYTITRDGQTINAVTTIDSPDKAITAQYQCNRSDFAAIAGATGGYDGGIIKIGDQFCFKLSRVAATADEYGGDALMQTAGIHYQCDTIGSRQIGTK